MRWHHVQNPIAVAEQVHGLRRRVSPEEAKAPSVRMELRADCLAGGWARVLLPALAAAALCAAPACVAGEADPGADLGEPRAEASRAARPVLGSSGMLGALQDFLAQRDVEVDRLAAHAAVRLMIDWFRFEPLEPLDGAAAADALVYRYGGWSEGCATAYKLSVLRQLTVRGADGSQTQSVAGITLLFDPGAFAGLPAFGTASSQFASIEAFLAEIEGSSGFRMLSAATPMGVALETGGLR